MLPERRSQGSQLAVNILLRCGEHATQVRGIALAEPKKTHLMTLSSRDPQDDDHIMDEFCMPVRFEKLRDQTERNRTSIEELEMKLKDLFVKVKDKTSSRGSRAIARGAACMAA